MRETMSKQWPMPNRFEVCATVDAQYRGILRDNYFQRTQKRSQHELNTRELIYFRFEASIS